MEKDKQILKVIYLDFFSNCVLKIKDYIRIIICVVLDFEICLNFCMFWSFNFILKNYKICLFMNSVLED